MNTDIEKQVAELAGNWRKWRDFCWYGKPDENADDYAIVYTHNRDSDLLTESNAAEIDKAMQPFIENETAVKESHNHWVCGWVEGYTIRCHNADGTPTAAILKWIELQNRLEDYPILNEEDLSERESEACWNNCEEAIKSWLRGLDTDAFDDNDIENGAVQIIYEWMSNHGELSRDGDGGRDGNGYYPDDDEIENAAQAIRDGWTPYGLEDNPTMAKALAALKEIPTE